MPIHDWTRVPSGLFHEFHQSWTIRIKDALNNGAMPTGLYAYVDRRVGKPEPDVIAVETHEPGKKKKRSDSRGGTAVLDAPRTKLIQQVEPDSVHYAKKANRITVRHHLGDVVAMIEVMSPGNKDGKNAFEEFIRKAAAFLRSHVHLLIIDLFPPTRRDPNGLHKAILEEFGDEPFDPPPGKPLTLVSYEAAPPLTAYIEPVAVGDEMPDMPLFLGPGEHVLVPLEATYLETWKVCPDPIKDLVEGRTVLPARGRRTR